MIRGLLLHVNPYNTLKNVHTKVYTTEESIQTSLLPIQIDKYENENTNKETNKQTKKQTNKLTLDENCFVASPPVRPLLLKLSLIGLVQMFVTRDDVRSGADP